MAVCSVRCLLTIAVALGILAVLVPVLIRVPVEIHPKDKGTARFMKLFVGFFMGISQIGEFLFGYESLLLYREILMRRFMTERNDTQPPDGLTVHNTAIAGVKVRIYARADADAEPKPAMVYIHGGGWILGFPEMYDSLIFRMLKEMDMVIISVKYRLAPEHAHPVPLQDCEVVTSHVLRNPEQFGIDKRRVSIAGDSAGGNLAAALALKLRDHPDLTPPKLQILIYPALQAFDFNTPSYVDPAPTVVLDKSQMLRFWLYYMMGNLDYLPAFLANNHTSAIAKRSRAAAYVSHTNLPPKFIPRDYTSTDPNVGDESVWEALGDYITNQFICPLMAKDLTNLPKTYLVTVNYDVLRDDGFFYAKRLKESGNDVSHTHYHDGFHGSFQLPNSFLTDHMQNNLIAYLKDNL